MATSMQICKVCGKEYPFCRTARPDGLYRWDSVACCPEHAAIYFAEVAAARAADTEVPTEDAQPVAEQASLPKATSTKKARSKKKQDNAAAQQ